MTRRRNVITLIASNLFAGIGVAASIAVVTLLAEQVANTEIAGVAQAVTSLGAGLAAVPLANLAARKGRRTSLGLGYVIPILGAVIVIGGAITTNVLLLFGGLALFGVAQAVNLQSRYAAAENASSETRARVMSVVIWATTIGSVVGPNLMGPGDRLGRFLGLPPYAGTYILTIIAYGLAAIGIIAFLIPPRQKDTEGPIPATPSSPLNAIQALGWVKSQPRARFAVVATGSAHAVMVMVMVMTPLHLIHQGVSLGFVGVVLSLHIMGMYALSPLFGWASDKFGALNIAVVGLGVLGLATALGFVEAMLRSSNAGLMMLALIVLGLGWSIVVIASSSILAGVENDQARVPLQGANDAIMNYAGAGAAAISGLILASGGFEAVNIAATVLLVPAGLLALSAFKARQITSVTGR